MHVTAAICTHNRAAAYLPRALASLLGQAPESPPFDILVVDNASRDDTAALVARVAAAHPGRVAYVHEPRLGLSHARNRAIAEARGEVLAFLDDDAVADPRWVATMHRRFLAEPRLGLLGGPALPIWEAPRPRWLDARLEGVLGLQAPSRNGRVIGANCAFRRAVLGADAFDPALGRSGERLLQGEDDAAASLVRRRGYAVAFDPELIVHHHVSRQRLTKRYFLRWAWGSGESLARMRPGRFLPVYLARAAGHAAGVLVDALRGDEAASFAHACEAMRKLAIVVSAARRDQSS